MARLAAEQAAKAFAEHQAMFEALEASLAEVLSMSDVICASILNGGRLLVCGNGGSAADAQHIAAELVGRFKIERDAMAAIALTTNTSTLTAIGNDYGFDEVFARQVDAYGRAGDVLLGISTSGNSANILRAIDVARERGMAVFGFCGGDGGGLASACDRCVIVPSSDTPRIQEAHSFLGHLLCGLIEEAVCCATP